MEPGKTSCGLGGGHWGVEAGASAIERHGTASNEPPAEAIATPLTAEECAIGQVLAGRYRVEGVIGRGSMGVVLAATHLGCDELVAIKFIRPEMRQITGIVSRFAREAKASVRVRNAHAVNVLDVDVTDPIGPFFAMEYLWGSHLEELVDSRGPLSVAAAAQYVLQACEALAAAHAQGIIHRDIKPQNMFLARQGTLESLKLLDFGISKAALSGQVFGDDLSSREQDWVMGTPIYMSPEQLRHVPDLDERTDIWSLGAVLYELLTGEPRFTGETHSQVSREILAQAPASAAVVIAGVPDELCQVIERCLAPDRDERFANVAELAAALTPFAPPSARLHVERAMALLGLEVTQVPNEDIEDLDVRPLEELARARRPFAWLGVAALGLACTLAVLGGRYISRGARSEVSSRPAPARAAIQTQRLALQPPAELGPAPVDDAPDSVRPDSVRPDSVRPDSSLAAAAAASAPPPPSASASPGAAARPAAPRPQRSAVSASSPPAPPEARQRSARAPARAAPARRLIRPKPPSPPTFRLIAEQPQSQFALVPAKRRTQGSIQLVKSQ